MDGKSIADSIKEVIFELNISSYSLGKMSGVSPVTIQRFLAGERGLTLATVEKLMGPLGLTVCRCEPEAAAPENGGGQEVDSQHEGLRFFDIDPGTGLRIGDDVTIRVAGINRTMVRIRIEAPPDAAVSRGELLEPRGAGIRGR